MSNGGQEYMLDNVKAEETSLRFKLALPFSPTARKLKYQGYAIINVDRMRMQNNQLYVDYRSQEYDSKTGKRKTREYKDLLVPMDIFRSLKMAVDAGENSFIVKQDTIQVALNYADNHFSDDLLPPEDVKGMQEINTLKVELVKKK
ncbi:MAG: hypothetical protein H6765_00070 [Candidatus Peribacteria bacterium]|nr:MAG: hypothetical protein H6765_00070 [Candidatus Peribacteria bacterium]